MNRPDEYAVEEAVRIRETIPDTSIEVLSVGPPRVSTVIRRALGMGAGHGIHIVTPEDGYLSPLVTASWIASFARNRSYDLILAGVMSEDDMQGQVGPMIAELLGMPCATSTIAERVAPETGTGSVELAPKLKHVPLLILHGEEDSVVSVGGARRVAARMEELGQIVELHVFPHLGHGYKLPNHIDLSLDFFDKHTRKP